MTSINVQSSEHTTRYVDPEGTPVPNAGQALLGGSSNAPKFGTLIPNRIFVGGIPSNTTEQELKTYFSGFGQVKDVKIINDRLGVSKGSYGFVTFENQEVAEQIIKNESETLIFKDRKLNIGHAIRKQQLFPRPADVPTTLFFTGGAIPCGFQGGMPMFPMPGQDYSLLAQPGSPYQQMLLQQANGAVYLSPQAQYSALQSQLAQPNALAALQQHHQQQYQQASLANPLNAGNLTPGSQNNQVAVMAAAAAAVAAASQWPNSMITPNQQSNQQLPLQNGHAQNGNQLSSGLGGLDSQPQVAALAAAVAAQQQLAAWRWPTQQNGLTQNQTTHAVLASSPVVSTSTSAQGMANSTTPNGQQQPQQQQSPIPASLGPSTYVYNPMAGAGHELLFIHQTNTSYTPNATSDYSTDHSAHSSTFLESVEQSSFHCDVSPPSRHSQSCGSAQNYSNPYEFTCVPPYNALTTMFDAVATSSPAMGHSMLQQHLHQQAGSGMLSVPTRQQLITLANSHLTQAQQHKLFGSIPQNVGPAGQNCQLGTPTLYGTPQPIILDVYSGGMPMAQMKPDGMITNSVESLGCARGTSPKKLTPVTTNISGAPRGIMDNLNSANNTTTRAM